MTHITTALFNVVLVTILSVAVISATKQTAKTDV